MSNQRVPDRYVRVIKDVESQFFRNLKCGEILFAHLSDETDCAFAVSLDGSEHFVLLSHEFEETSPLELLSMVDILEKHVSD
jgi:hypothetical protein